MDNIRACGYYYAQKPIRYDGVRMLHPTCDSIRTSHGHIETKACAYMYFVFSMYLDEYIPSIDLLHYDVIDSSNMSD